MGQLLSHLVILILLYRYYKRIFGEWSGWHVILFGWLVVTFMGVEVGTTFFWEYKSKGWSNLLLYLYLSSILVGSIYTVVNLMLWVYMLSRYSESWLACLFRYYNQLYLVVGGFNWYRFYRWAVKVWLYLQLYGGGYAVIGYWIIVVWSVVWSIGGVLLIWGAIGYYDYFSYEAWWHYLYWNLYDWVIGLHYIFLVMLGGVICKYIYLKVIYIFIIKDINTGIIYRLWIKPSFIRRVVMYDKLYLQNLRMTRSSKRWYSSRYIKLYEVPADWYSYHYYNNDWNYVISKKRFMRYSYLNQWIIRILAKCYDKYKREAEFSMEISFRLLCDDKLYG